MKRSNMIKKLAEFICMFYDEDVENSKHMADQILRVCEKEGMVPPYCKDLDTFLDGKGYKWELEEKEND